MPRDLLTLDVMRDMRRVDAFVNRLINDRSLQKRFFYNPSRVMIELGFHSATTNKAIGITNRVFYAALSNRWLVRYVLATMPRLKVPQDLKRKTLEGLDKGRIEVDTRIDEIAIEAFWKDEKQFRNILLVFLQDLNRKRILSRRFSTAEIRSWVEKVVVHVRERRPVRELPQLDRFGPHYGVGVVPDITKALDVNGDAGADSGADAGAGAGADSGADAGAGAGADSGADAGAGAGADSGADAGADSGAGAGADGDNNVAVIEVAIAGTVVLVVEVAIPATVFGEVVVTGDVEDPEFNINQMIQRSYAGDATGLKAAATMLKLLSFASDLATYVQNVDQHGYFGQP